MVFQFFADRSEAGGHTVDRKHPYGGMTGQGLVLMLPERSQTGPEAFHAPAAKPAENKVLNMFFHMDSILGKTADYSAGKKFNEGKTKVERNGV